MQQDGTLSFDSTKFDAAFASNPQSVKDFFTTATNGFSDRLKSTVDRLAAGKNAILVNHLQALNTTITNDNDKIKQWTARLDAERNTLLLSFYRMDNAIAQMQSQMALLNQIQGIGIFANGFSGSGSLGSTTGSSSSSGASSGASGSGSTSGNTTSTTG